MARWMRLAKTLPNAANAVYNAAAFAEAGSGHSRLDDRVGYSATGKKRGGRRASRLGLVRATWVAFRVPV